MLNQTYKLGAKLESLQGSSYTLSISTFACAGSPAAVPAAATGEDSGEPSGASIRKTTPLCTASSSLGDPVDNASDNVPEPPVPEPREIKVAVDEVDEEPETPYPVAHVNPEDQQAPPHEGQIPATPPLDNQCNKEEATRILGDASAPPSVRIRKYLKAVKANNTKKADETEETCNGREETYKAKVKKGEETEETCNGTDETYKAKVIASLPPKPTDWGKHAPVTADQQQPPKPRGRKKKSEKDTSDDKKTEPKAKAKRGAKKRAKTPETYEPLQVEGNIKIDKRDAFDAYAVASAAADVHALDTTDTKATEPSNASKKPRRSKQDKEEPNKAASRTRSKRKDSGDDAPSPETEGSTKRSKKNKNNEAALNENKDGQESKEDEPMTSKPKTARKELSADIKARYSRKSCAYKKVLIEKKKEGYSEEDAKKAAREVSKHCLNNTLGMSQNVVSVFPFKYSILNPKTDTLRHLIVCTFSLFQLRPCLQI